MTFAIQASCVHFLEAEKAEEWELQPSCQHFIPIDTSEVATSECVCVGNATSLYSEVKHAQTC